LRFLQQIFDKVRAVKAEIMQKVIFISGDITVDGLALSSHDEATLTDDVNVVFHCAANVRFNDPLKDAVNINTAGTLRVLSLAEKMKNLKVFSYMSTAFSQSYQSDLEERYYPSSLDAFEIIKLTEKLDGESLNNLEKSL
jgi:alcohol-forming fatty acyl-CoA reductase